MTTNLLLVAFLFGAFGVLALSAWYVFSLGQMHQMRPAALAANQNRVLVRALVVEAMEYRKRNPAIDPILQSINLAPALNTNAVPKKANAK